MNRQKPKIGKEREGRINEGLEHGRPGQSGRCGRARVGEEERAGKVVRPCYLPRIRILPEHKVIRKL